MMKRLFFTFLSALVAFASSAETLSGKQLELLNQKIRQYNYVGPFSDGLAMVRKDGKAGFIDKTGKLVIPLKFNATDRCVSPTDKFDNIFLNGILGSQELGVIDKQGNVLVPKDSIKNLSFASEGNVVIVQTQSGFLIYEKGKLISKKHPVYNWHTGKILTVNGKFVYEEDLEAEGYTRDYYGSLYMPFENGIFIVSKNGKYGMIDDCGKELYPCTQSFYRMGYHKGLSLIPNNVEISSDNGNEYFPIWYDIYKDGVKVLEKISTQRRFKGLNFVSVCGISEEKYDYWKNENKIELPLSTKDTMMFDLNGKRIKRAPFGKNFFTLDKNGNINYVKKDGTPVFSDDVVVIYEPIGPYYLIEFNDDWRPRVLNENGDTIKANSKLLSYVNDGTISFYDLRKYTNIEDVEFPYISILPKADKVATLEYHAGRMDVNPPEGDKSFFSEGLINVKINGVWFYMDEKGFGTQKK